MQINVFFKAITMVFLTAVCVATIPAFHYSSMLKGLVGDQLTMRANSTAVSRNGLRVRRRGLCCVALRTATWFCRPPGTQR